VPTSEAHSLSNQLQVAIGRQRGLPFVAECVTESAGGDDIRPRRGAPILASYKVLAGALEVLGLLWCNAVLIGEFKRVVSPHWNATIKAAAGLLGEGVCAGTHQGIGHEKLLKVGRNPAHAHGCDKTGTSCQKANWHNKHPELDICLDEFSLRELVSATPQIGVLEFCQSHL